MEIRALEPGDQPALEQFLRRIPEGDRTFFKEAVNDPTVIAAWVQEGAGRWLAVDDEVASYGKGSRAIVATVDAALLTRLRRMRVDVITLRSGRVAVP